MRRLESGGFRRNASSILNVLSSSYDVMIFVETFLTEESAQLVQFQSDFFYFSSFGLRSEGEEEGRAAGGIMIFLRSSIFDAPSCKTLSSSRTLLAVQVKPKHSAPFA
jgi:hypothetical protein